MHQKTETTTTKNCRSKLKRLPSICDWERYHDSNATSGLTYVAYHPDTDTEIYAGSAAGLTAMIYSKQDRDPNRFPRKSHYTSNYMQTQPQYLKDWVLALHPALQQIVLRATYESMHNVLGVDALSHRNVVQEFRYEIFNRYPGDELCDPRDNCNLSRMLQTYLYDAARLPLAVVHDLHLALCVHWEYVPEDPESERQRLFDQFRGDLEKRFFFWSVKPSKDILPYLAQETDLSENFVK